MFIDFYIYSLILERGRGKSKNLYIQHEYYKSHPNTPNYIRIIVLRNATPQISYSSVEDGWLFIPSCRVVLAFSVGVVEVTCRVGS